MARNYVSEGAVMPWTNTTGNAVVSGQVVAIGHTIVVALGAIADGAEGPVAVDGVFEVPKVSAAVFVQGEKLLWDVSANDGDGAFDDSSATPAAGDILGAVIAWKAGANLETTCLVKLTPGNATLTAGGG